MESRGASPGAGSAAEAKAPTTPPAQNPVAEALIAGLMSEGVPTEASRFSLDRERARHGMARSRRMDAARHGYLAPRGHGAPLRQELLQELPEGAGEVVGRGGGPDGRGQPGCPPAIDEPVDLAAREA